MKCFEKFSKKKKSFESPGINDEYDNSTFKYEHNPQSGIITYQISSMITGMEQLEADLQQQDEYEKDTLHELNQRFYILIDRIKFLQSENLKYLATIANIRQKSFDYNTTKIEEDYSTFWSNILLISNEKIDYDWDYEIFQSHIRVYKKLISIEDQSKNNELPSLEKELNHSSSVLINLRTSYEQLQQEINNLSIHNEDLSKQYFELTTEWYHLKLKQQKSELKIEKLKNYITFYKNLRLYTTEESQCLSVDMNQLLKIDIDQLLKRIRRDFENFYSNIYQQMIEYYQTKTNDLQTDINQILHYQKNEFEQYMSIQNKLQREYDKLEKDLTYEKDVFINLESTFSKLNADFKSLQLQHDEETQRQSNELCNFQEGIMTIVYDIDEIRRSKANLEVELIIYRQLLNASGVESPSIIVYRLQPVINNTTEKFAVNKKQKGSIGIKECAPNGTYISLMNFSKNKIIDLSNWVITRYIDTKIKILYTIPDDTLLKPNRELRIYTKLNENIINGETISYAKLINTQINSWGEGNMIKTYLFNSNGDEEASYKQSLVVQKIR